MPRAQVNSASLIVPTSPIHLLITQFYGYMFLADPLPVYVMLSVIAANFVTGDPVWLMLVGPGGCGKTKLIRAFSTIPQFHEAGPVRSEAQLLSGTPKKERRQDATGGILRKIGTGGTLVFKDFTSILSLPGDALKTVIAALRECSDGEWTRSIGSEGGMDMIWRGKMACIGGCTPVIDRMYHILSEMGQRWIFFRYPDSTGTQESLMNMSANDPGRETEYIQAAVQCFFECLDMGWEKPYHDREELSNRESSRILNLAMFSAKSRSPVIRSLYGSREIEEVSQGEPANRLAGVFAQIYRGGKKIGLTEKECLAVISRLAMDSIPGVRRKILELLIQDRRGRTEEELEIDMQVSRGVMRRTLEDLQIHGVLERLEGRRRMWVLSKFTGEKLEAYTGL